MNVTKVLQHLETLDTEIEEALTAVEGLQISEGLDLDSPTNSRERAWSSILHMLKLADWDISHSLAEVKEIEAKNLVAYLVKPATPVTPVEQLA